MKTPAIKQRRGGRKEKIEAGGLWSLQPADELFVVRTHNWLLPGELHSTDSSHGVSQSMLNVIHVAASQGVRFEWPYLGAVSQ